jgi:hypothetical protein
MTTVTLYLSPAVTMTPYPPSKSVQEMSPPLSVEVMYTTTGMQLLHICGCNYGYIQMMMQQNAEEIVLRCSNSGRRQKADEILEALERVA